MGLLIMLSLPLIAMTIIIVDIVCDHRLKALKIKLELEKNKGEE